jgi:hypothetical protein
MIKTEDIYLKNNIKSGQIIKHDIRNINNSSLTMNMGSSIKDPLIISNKSEIQGFSTLSLTDNIILSSHALSISSHLSITSSPLLSSINTNKLNNSSWTRPLEFNNS